MIAGDIIVENSVNASSRCIGRNLLITQDILDRIGRDTISASFCKVFRLKKPELAPVVHLNLKYLYDEGRMAFYQHVATNGIGNFQAKRFVESESIALPNSDELQSKMIGLLQGLTTSIYSSKNVNLRQTRDLLLSKLISGEVDVEGLEIAVVGDTREVEMKAVEV